MTIDVHAHFVPAAVLEALEVRGRDFGVNLVEIEPGRRCCEFSYGLRIRPFFEGLLNVDLRLGEMDRQGVEREVLTLWTDMFGYELPGDKGAAWHRVLNDSLARLCDTHANRFCWMASGPLQHPAAAARELERCMGAGALGAIVSANVCGDNLGERDLDEFWAACVALRAPVFVHPTQPTAAPRADRFALNQICAYTYDTTLAIGSMIFSGVLDRHPDLQLILSHGGGALPYLIGRFDRMHRAADRNATGNVAAEPPSAYLPRFHYDTILHDDAALTYLKGLVGSGRLLLGSDLPFPPGDPDPLATLRAAFRQDEVDQIASVNPRALFRLDDYGA